MKTNVKLSLATLLSAMLLTSCLSGSEDDYNWQGLFPEGATMATVAVASKTAGDAIVDDDESDKSLYVVNPSVLTTAGANSEGQRIFYTYKSSVSPVGDQDSRTPFVEITWAYSVLTKEVDVLNTGEADSFGVDQLLINACYVSKQHLNLKLIVQASDSGFKHVINMVKAESASVDDDGYMPLELRYDAAGDASTVNKIAFVSFPLSSIEGYTEGVVKGLSITYRSLSGNDSALKVALKK